VATAAPMEANKVKVFIIMQNRFSKVSKLCFSYYVNYRIVALITLTPASKARYISMVPISAF
jgi:hypothetical protein